LYSLATQPSNQSVIAARININDARGLEYSNDEKKITTINGMQAILIKVSKLAKVIFLDIALYILLGAQ
jgi:hypothetical protein